MWAAVRGKVAISGWSWSCRQERPRPHQPQPGHQPGRETITIEFVKTNSPGFGVIALAATALVSCTSSPPPPPPPPPAPAASASAQPTLLEVGTLLETSTGLVTVQSIDAAERTLVLQREGGDTARFKAGPEIRRFNEVKVGDQIMTTVTENCTLFVVKGEVPQGAAASQAVVRTPDGQNLGGIVVNAINLNVKLLDVDRLTRRVLYQYGPSKTRSVKVKPGVDLSRVSVGDTVLVRGTQTISVMVADGKPAAAAAGQP